MTFNSAVNKRQKSTDAGNLLKDQPETFIVSLFNYTFIQSFHFQHPLNCGNEAINPIFFLNIDLINLKHRNIYAITI